MEKIKLSSKQKAADGLTWFVLMGLMTFSITYMLVNVLKFNYSFLRLIAINLICLGIWSIILMNKLTRRITAAFLILSFGGGSFYFYKKHLLKTVYDIIVEKVTPFGEWCLKCIQGYEVQAGQYIDYFVIILSLLTALIIYLLTIKKFSFLLLFFAGTSVFVFEVTQKKTIHNGALYLFILTSLVYFFKSRYLVLKKQLDENNYSIYSAFMRVSMLIGAGIVLGGAVLSHQIPYKAKWFHEIAEALTRKEYYYVADSFSIKSAGLQQEDNLLGGNITPNNVTVLEVQTAASTYLKADSRAIYTGHTWKNEEEEARVINLKNEKLEDTAETEEASKWLGGNKDSINKLFYKNKAVIRFINITTKSIFIPPKMISFENKSFKRDIYVKNMEDLSFQKPAHKNFVYATEFYEPKYTNDEFKAIIRKSKIGFYKEAKGRYPEDAESISKWEIRAEEITKKYTQLPENLPKRVKDLAKSITKDKKTNYDKVKAIEEYLSNNYYYTLKPGKPKPEEDFVDQFLFEKKRGYCTYFASAMAVLTRSIGIPSRYSEGYALPQNKDPKQSAYRVSNQRAHAWAEVYFEGLGWIRFEATPPYRQQENTAPAGVSMEEAMRHGQSGYVGGELNNAVVDETETFNSGLLAAALPLVGGLGVAAGIMIFFKIRKHRLQQMDSREAVLYLYEKYLELLTLRKLSIQPGETEKTFAARVDKIMMNYDISFKEMTDLYVKARYSQMLLTEEEKQQMIHYKYSLLKSSKRVLRKHVYLAYKIKYAFL